MTASYEVYYRQQQRAVCRYLNHNIPHFTALTTVSLAQFSTLLIQQLIIYVNSATLLIQFNINCLCCFQDNAMLFCISLQSIFPIILAPYFYMFIISLCCKNCFQAILRSILYQSGSNQLFSCFVQFRRQLKTYLLTRHGCCGTQRLVFRHQQHIFISYSFTYLFTY